MPQDHIIKSNREAGEEGKQTPRLMKDGAARLEYHYYPEKTERDREHQLEVDFGLKPEEADNRDEERRRGIEKNTIDGRYASDGQVEEISLRSHG